jgi:hypothetical protein
VTTAATETGEAARPDRMPTRIFTPVPAAVAAVALLVSLLWTPAELPAVEVCWFKAKTGLPCPGCGLTRGCCAIGHGDFAAAWRYNPFSFAFYGVGLAFFLGPLAARRWPGLEAALRRWKVLIWGPPLLMLSLTLFGLVRLAVLLT